MNTRARGLMTTLTLMTLACLPTTSVQADDAHTIRLADVTESSGLDATGGDRFSFADLDADGDPDLLVNGTRLFRNDTTTADGETTIVFTDVTDTSGVKAGGGGGGCFVDLDGDGDLDIVTPSGAIKIQVKPWTFENRAEAFGVTLETKMSTVGVGDVNGDGWPDVLFGGGELWKDNATTLYPRMLFQSVKGESFEDVTSAHDLGESRYGRAVVFADFDVDGDVDAYLGNYRLQPNELLVNDAGTLTNEGQARGVEGRLEPDTHYDEATNRKWGFQYGHTIAASWADLDADGDLDLWVSNLVHKYVGPTDHPQIKYDIRGYICDDSAIYQNDGRPAWGFTDMRDQSGVALMPIGGRGTYRGDELWSNSACGDLDGDGLPEVFVAQVYDLPYSHTLLYRNKGGFQFEEISGDVGVRRFASYGGAFADLDGDGDLDLVCGGKPEPKGKASIRVYRNDTASAPYAAFRLEGRAPNTQALGAQVTLESDQGVMVRQVESCMGSHCQQNENVLRFGLRSAKVVRAWVRWPGNVIQVLGDVAPGGVRTLSQPKVTFPDQAQAFRVEPLDTGGVRVFLKSSAKRWSVDLDGAGFEPVDRDAKTIDVPAECIEVRLRRAHTRKQGVFREYVLRPGRADDGG